MNYRAEIDGLRTFAVVPVILFHAGFEVAEGGFVGVDIFFVISGYLITRLLIHDLEAEQLRIIAFYERRARRILPALLVMVGVCLPFAWMWMLPEEFNLFSRSLVAVGTFTSNILFWQESGYFALASETKPLLHTWSLAIEEQFYLLFPIFLLILAPLGRTRIFFCVLGAAVFSFVLCEWGHRYYPTANFYLLPTRVWELLAGSMAAFLLRDNLIKPNEVGALAGFLGILYAILTYDKTTPFPSAYTLVPVLGTVLVILYASSANHIGSFLGAKLFVGIGLLSYSAYLWHQPILAFLKIRRISEPSSFSLLAAVSVSFIVAYLSWKYIEAPFRRPNSRGNYRNTIVLLGGLVVFIGVGSGAIYLNGLPQRFTGEISRLDAFRSIEEEKRGKSCSSIIGYKQRERCVLGNDNNIRGVLLGDSHAQMLWSPLDKLLDRRGIGFMSFTAGGCPPVFEIWRRDVPNNCSEYNEEVFRYIKNNKDIQFIILNGRWTIHIEGERFNNREGGVEPGRSVITDVINHGVKETNPPEIRRAQLLSKFESSIRRFSALNRKLLIAYPVPEVGFTPAVRMAKQLLFTPNIDITPTHSFEVYRDRNERVRSLFDILKSDLPSIQFTDVANDLCDHLSGRCRTFNSNLEPLYIDGDHLSSHGAGLLVRDIELWMNTD